jgi:hypothetical protein
MVFGLKRPSMSVQNLFFARPTHKKPSLPLFSITGCGKRHQDVFPAPIFTIFHNSGLLFLPESEIRACKLLVDPGHLQGELVEGRSQDHYRKAGRCHPGVDRALQKTHILLMTMLKIYLKYVPL